MYYFLRSRFGPMLDRTVKSCYMPRRFSSSSGSNDSLPTKPKTPLTAHQRFRLEMEPKLKLENPSFSPQELKEIARDLWRELSMDAKLPYRLAAKKEAAEYVEACKLYECSLTDEQSAKILIRKARNFRKRESREFGDMILQTGKPSRPVPVFSRFMSYLKTENIPVPTTKTSYREAVQEMWRTLEPAVKEKLCEKYKRDFEAYVKQKAEWEEKILTDFQKWEDIRHIVRKEKTMTDFKRPVKPPTAFLLYLEEIKKYNGKVPIDEVNRKWINMPKKQKEIYLTEAQKLYDNYIKELDEWNKKMDEHLGAWASKIPSERS